MKNYAIRKTDMRSYPYVELKTKRVYVYTETYNKIMKWGVKNLEIGNIISPNNKPNFPYFLKKFIEKIKV